MSQLYSLMQSLGIGLSRCLIQIYYRREGKKEEREGGRDKGRDEGIKDEMTYFRLEEES